MDIAEEVLQEHAVLLKLAGPADDLGVHRFMTYCTWLLGRQLNQIVVDLDACSGDIRQLAKAILATRWSFRREGGNVIVVCRDAATRTQLTAAGITALVDTLELARVSLRPTPSHDRPCEVFVGNP